MLEAEEHVTWNGGEVSGEGVLETSSADKGAKAARQREIQRLGNGRHGVRGGWVVVRLQKAFYACPW